MMYYIINTDSYEMLGKDNCWHEPYSDKAHHFTLSEARYITRGGMLHDDGIVTELIDVTKEPGQYIIEQWRDRQNRINEALRIKQERLAEIFNKLTPDELQFIKDNYQEKSNET